MIITSYRLILLLFIFFSYLSTMSFPSIAMILDEENKEDINFKRKITPINRTEFLEHIENENITIISNDREKVLQWLGDNIFGSEQSLSKCTERSMFAVEAVSGVLRGAVFFKLGYDFGKRITATVGGPGSTTLAVIYGMGVFVPIAVLGTNLTSKIFKEIIHKKPDAEEAIEFKKTRLECFGEYAMEISAISAGLISAPPITYLTYDKLHDYLSLGWVIPAAPAFYVRALLDYYAITTLGKMLWKEIEIPLDRRFAETHPNSRGGVITRIRDQLSEVRSFIASLNHSQAQALVNELNQRDDFSQKFCLLSHPQSFIEEEILVKKDGWGKKILGFVGGLIGGYGTWVYYPVAKASFIPIVSLLGIAPTDELLTGLAVASISTASSLTALATWSSTHKFYEAISGLSSSTYNYFTSCCKPQGESAILLEEKSPTHPAISIDDRLKWKRIGTALLSIVLAAFNAGMQGEVALEFLDMSLVSSQFNLTAAVIAYCSLSFWPIDDLLLSYLKAGDPRTPLLGQIDKVIEKLSSMSDEALKSLEQLLQENSNVRPNEII